MGTCAPKYCPHDGYHGKQNLGNRHRLANIMDFTLVGGENELESIKNELIKERKRSQELEEKLALEKSLRLLAEKQLQEKANQNVDIETIAKQRIETEEQVAQLKRELEHMRCEREKIARQVETEQEFM